MTSYIALLRGVNVGGITVKSAELGELFDGLGFEGVRTVLASGNVVFETTKREAHLPPHTTSKTKGPHLRRDATPDGRVGQNGVVSHAGSAATGAACA